MQRELTDAFLAYDTWATTKLLSACQALTPEEFSRHLPIGHGNVVQTLMHLTHVYFFFADRLLRRPPSARIDLSKPAWSLNELSPWLTQSQFEFTTAVAHILSQHALSDVLHWTDVDTSHAAAEDQVTYAVALAQMIDHGIHHRTQVMDMLRLLNYSDSTAWHPFEWDEAERFG